MKIIAVVKKICNFLSFGLEIYNATSSPMMKAEMKLFPWRIRNILLTLIHTIHRKARK